MGPHTGADVSTSVGVDLEPTEAWQSCLTDTLSRTATGGPVRSKG